MNARAHATRLSAADSGSPRARARSRICSSSSGFPWGAFRVGGGAAAPRRLPARTVGGAATNELMALPPICEKSGPDISVQMYGSAGNGKLGGLVDNHAPPDSNSDNIARRRLDIVQAGGDSAPGTVISCRRRLR